MSKVSTCSLSAVIALAFSLIITSCLPAPVYRLSTDSMDAQWLQGIQTVTQRDSSVDIQLAFIRTSQGDLVFDLEVTNMSNKAMLVSPERCVAYPFDKAGMPLASNGVNISHPARNPEDAIAAIDKRFASEQSAYSTINAIDATVSLFGLIGDIVTIGNKKTREEMEMRDSDRKHLECDRINRDISFANSTEALRSERGFWSDVALRRTTLLPNQSTRGEIHFPAERKAELLKIVIVVENHSMEFVFRQLKL